MNTKIRQFVTIKIVNTYRDKTLDKPYVAYLRRAFYMIEMGKDRVSYT